MFGSPTPETIEPAPSAGDLGISVIMPAYNHERFIEEALRSALDQSVPPSEVVVVDDGSTDGTAASVEAVAATDARIRLIQQPNGGSHAAINRGLAEVRSPWIAILNSDDRWHPQRLERLQAEARLGASFVVTGARLIDEHGQPVEDADHWWHRTQRSFLEQVRAQGPVNGLLMGNHTVSTSNFFFSRALADAVGPVRPYRYIPDWDWALRAALADPGGYRFLLDEPLLDYRLHGRNAILQQIIRGDLEIRRMHRGLLSRYGVPRPLQAALFRNLRDLRRQWRACGMRPLEQMVREREADVALLKKACIDQELGLRKAESWLSERQGEVNGLREQLRTTQEWLEHRMADVEQLKSRAGKLESWLLDREQDVSVLRDLNDQLQTLVDEAQSSLIWRCVRRLRRRYGWTRL